MTSATTEVSTGSSGKTGVRRQHLPQTNEEGSVDEVAFESGLGGREDNVPDEEGAGHSRHGELLVPRRGVL